MDQWERVRNGATLHLYLYCEEAEFAAREVFPRLYIAPVCYKYM